jgi:alkylation response protein AidB-like acyl-CoA dehydrogenase
VRTGTPESAHRGITALFVDMDSPGITVRPIETMHGRPEFCEVFLDEVAVPLDRTLGEEGQGWAVAMDLLPYERSTALWHRGAFLHRRLGQLLATVATAPAPAVSAGGSTPAPPAPPVLPALSVPPAVSADEVGSAFCDLFAFRARSRATQHRLHAGETLGAETSVDKILLATTEQAVFDLVLGGLRSEVLIGDDPPAERWRAEHLYARAATIYGGSAEIQRNIVARRLLDLGDDR